MRTGRDGLVGDRAIRDAAGSAATPVADAEIGYREVSFVHLIGACNGGRYPVTFGKSVTIPRPIRRGNGLLLLLPTRAAESGTKRPFADDRPMSAIAGNPDIRLAEIEA
jgi:hypothetical protein